MEKPQNIELSNFGQSRPPYNRTDSANSDDKVELRRSRTSDISSVGDRSSAGVTFKRGIDNQSFVTDETESNLKYSGNFEDHDFESIFGFVPFLTHNFMTKLPNDIRNYILLFDS